MASFSLDDTIAAISTPLGEGGVGIVKISGPLAGHILDILFVRPGGGGSFVPRMMHWGHIAEPDSGTVVDEVLATLMPGPRSYTRQDVVEIQSHGGIVPVRKILQLVLAQGARLAEPGEMTLRAFVNGRLDLAQAEAVLDVVQARTDAALRAAVDQLGGHLSGQVRRVRGLLVAVLAYLEASIDFVDDEIPRQDVLVPLGEAKGAIESLLAGADRGIIYRHGVRVAIVGRPNVGKSSLLNTLLRGDRAIVTPLPGTTRDTLEETVNLQGVPVVLVDTAGIRQEAAGEVERLGVDRSREALKRADLALLVVDGSRPLTGEDLDVARAVGEKAALVVVNKNDLAQARPSDVAALLPNAAHVSVSALTGAGIEHLEDAIARVVLGGQVLASDTPLVTSPRHQTLLRAAVGQVDEAIEGWKSDRDADLIAIDVRDAVDSLGEITGETAGEDLIQAIFSQFCIGK